MPSCTQLAKGSSSSKEQQHHLDVRTLEPFSGPDLNTANRLIRNTSDSDDIIYEGIPVFTNWSDFAHQLEQCRASMPSTSVADMSPSPPVKVTRKKRRAKIGPKRSGKPNNIVTSPYAAALLATPDGISKYVDLYDANSSATRNQAYYRVRAKLTPELARLLESDDEEKINAAVYQFARRQGDKKIDYEQERVLRERLSSLLRNHGKRYAQAVLYHGLPLFPKEELPKLMSQHDDIFKDAAKRLVECYKEAKFVRTNSKKVKGKEISGA